MTRFMMKAYAILKHEDIPPYIDDKILIICDGLGGSGSMLHVLNDEQKQLKEDDYTSILYPAPLIDDADVYDKTIIEALMTEDDHTSAFYASRIVGLNLKRYLILNEKINAKELTSLLIEQLHHYADNMGFDKTMAFGQVLLPTTLMAYTFKEDDEHVYLNALYAGDSRGYMIYNNQFSQLTKDDEDASGSLTNLIYAASSDHQLRIHHKTYTLKKPCILIGISDGGFDPFEPYSHHGCAYALYNIIKESLNSLDFEVRFKDYFDHIRQDDTTIGIVSFGYQTFDDFKNAMLTTLRPYHDNYEKYVSQRHYFPLIDLNKESILAYVIQRSIDKKQAIVKRLIDDVMHDVTMMNHEPFVLEFNRLKESLLKTKKEQLLKQLYQDIYHILDHEELLMIDIINPVSPNYQKLSNDHTNIKRMHEKLSLLEEAFKLESETNQSLLKDWVIRLKSISSDTKFSRKTQRIIDIYEDSKQLISVWSKHYQDLHDDNPTYQKLYQEALTLIDSKQKELMIQEDLLDQHMQIDQALSEFISELKEFMLHTDDFEDLFDNSFLSTYGLRVHHDQIRLNQGDIETIIISHFVEHDQLFVTWIDALLLSETPTPYDLYYNLTKLQQAKWFMKHENEDLLIIKELRKTLYNEEEIIESYSESGEEHA